MEHTATLQAWADSDIPHSPELDAELARLRANRERADREYEAAMDRFCDAASAVLEAAFRPVGRDMTIVGD